MSKSIIKINGKIDKILKTNEDGSIMALFKNENTDVFNLKSSIIMVEITKKQWGKFKDNPNVLDLYFTINGWFEIRTKNEKPYLYVKSNSIIRLKAKGKKSKIEEINKMNEIYQNEIEQEKKDIEIQRQKEGNFWFKKIEEEEFIKMDINKVKLTSPTHLNSILPVYNIKRFKEINTLYPIAIKEIPDSEEYELITGLRSFIAAKLLSLKVNAYITNLDRETFKEKYSLEK